MRGRECAFIFFIGGALYGLMEVVFRGYTHWTMVLTGGACLLCFYLVDGKYPNMGMLGKCICSCGIITGFEFVVGCIVNLWLGLGVWSYSMHALNLLGQVCPMFSAFWFLIGIPATYVCRFLRGKLSAAEEQSA
ncbi:MAG: putative ABC transporter permease [Oscillospiraceae bacterium]|jgi:uncharacterized membrane protein